jgi:hypothetical protein
MYTLQEINRNGPAHHGISDIAARPAARKNGRNPYPSSGSDFVRLACINEVAYVGPISTGLQVRINRNRIRASRVVELRAA